MINSTTNKIKFKSPKKHIVTWSLWNILGLIHFDFNDSMFCNSTCVPLYVVDSNNARANGSFTLQFLLSWKIWSCHISVAIPPFVAQILTMVLNYKGREVQIGVTNNEICSGIQQTWAIIHESDNNRLSIRQLAKTLSKIITS